MVDKSVPTMRTADPQWVGSYRVLGELKDDQIYHVYPNFGREHVTDKRDQCWCYPGVEFLDGGAIILHEVEQ